MAEARASSMFLDVKDPFLRAYLQCAFWSSSDQSDEGGGAPLDDERYDESMLAPEAFRQAKLDCARFLVHAAQWLDGDDAARRAGHDFWLTRNGHGAGFWDGDWPEPEATELTKLAKSFGEACLYVGDDGRIYYSEG